MAQRDRRRRRPVEQTLHWPPWCIDYWVYVDGNAHQARLSVEGWGLDDDLIDLSGNGELDGVRIGSSVARILRVPAPRH
jgi:hypothetical protein